MSHVEINIKEKEKAPAVFFLPRVTFLYSKNVEVIHVVVFFHPIKDTHTYCLKYLPFLHTDF